MTYAKAGVDVDKAGQFVKIIKNIAKQTPRSGVMGEIGGFGGLFAPNLTNIENPIMVSSTDGVGTKLKIATMMNKHDTIGIDLVAMCVNDVAVQGAKILFFLDYLSMGQLDTDLATNIIKGIGEGCRQANCALIGGETAEMPGFYQKGQYDLAGFTVGIVDNNKIIDGSEIRVGHMLISIPSNGLHSNGYSLVRKICFETLKLEIDSYLPDLGTTIGEELLKPTRIYCEIIQTMIRYLSIKGLAHITGGGITDNIVRIIPNSCNIVLQKGSWDVPPIFDFLQKSGCVSVEEMMRTFNNGIGLVAVAPEKEVPDILERLRAMNENAFVIGEVVERKDSGSRIKWI